MGDDFRPANRSGFFARHGNTIIISVLAAVTLVVGVLSVRQTHPELLSGLLGTGPDPAAAAAPVPVTPTVDLAHPFAGTAVEGWADGEAGIVAPAAAPLAGFTRAQVADALDRARRALISARIDPRVLHGTDVHLLADQFAAPKRAEVLTSPHLRTAIAEGSTLLDGVPVKVTGTMTVQAGRRGELIIDMNHSFAYAFTPRNRAVLTGPMQIISVVRAQAQYGFYGLADWPGVGRGLIPLDHSRFFYSMSCSAAVRGYLAPADAELVNPGGDTPEEDRKRIFDPSLPMPDPKGTC